MRPRARHTADVPRERTKPVLVQARVSAELADAVRVRAGEMGVTASEFVRIALYGEIAWLRDRDSSLARDVKTCDTAECPVRPSGISGRGDTACHDSPLVLPSAL